MAKTVEVLINEDGSFSVDLNGFHGKGCKDVLKAFEKIGKAKGPDKIKPEFYQTQVTQNIQKK